MAAPKTKRGSGDRGRRCFREGARDAGDEVVANCSAGCVGLGRLLGMAMATSEVMARKAAVAKKKYWMPAAEDRRTSTGHAMAPRPHTTFSMAMRRARAAGTVVPAMTFPAVRPAPSPRPVQKSAMWAGPKPTQARAIHPAAVMAEP